MEVDLSRLQPSTALKVDEILRHDFNRLLFEASQRQVAIAARNHLHRPRARDGFGERVMELDPVFDAFWRIAYGHDYSQQQDLMKFLMRRNPEIAVRSQGCKIMVGWTPNKREVKKYTLCQ
jgi:hypothetical protein